MSKRLIHYLKLTLFLGALAITTFGLPKNAKACCSCSASYAGAYLLSWPTEVWLNAFARIEMKIGALSEIAYLPPGADGHRQWTKDVIWNGMDGATAMTKVNPFQAGIKDALSDMTTQLKSVAMYQSFIFGTFLDAKAQLESQQLLQRLEARAHKDYQTSIGLCEFGSHVKTLAATEERAAVSTQALRNHAQNKALGNANMVNDADKSRKAQLEQYRTTFCDPNDLNGKLEALCQHDYQDTEVYVDEEVGGENANRLNKDIDFVRTLDTPWTLNVDFSDEVLTNHEEEILALSSNLYMHDNFEPVSAEKLASTSANSLSEAQEVYMDMRAVHAKSSVARNSFDELVGLKAAGAPGSKEFVIAVMKEILDSNPDPEAAALLLVSDTPDDPAITSVEPSYHAQMEILTKKLIQSPDFFTELYDKPANVNRKRVALQAISLMQKFDLFKSHLRNEANLSILLELALEDLQAKFESEIGSQETQSNTISAPGLPSLP